MEDSIGKPTRNDTLRTLEELLANKFHDLQLAREDKNALYFDEFSRSIEILLRANHRAFQEFNAEKTEMDEDLRQEYLKIQNEMNSTSDSITRQVVGSQKLNEVDWEYRKAYEELVMDTLIKYDLIPSAQLVAQTEEVYQENPTQPKAQPQPKPIQQEPKKKPRLLQRTKDKFSV